MERMGSGTPQSGICHNDSPPLESDLAPGARPFRFRGISLRG